MTSKILLIFSIMGLYSLELFAQTELPIDPESGLVVFTGKRNVELKSKKKMLEGMNTWVMQRLPYPPMVFSVISSTKDSLIIKAVTEVPSLKELHPISFRLILLPGKRKFNFQADHFYFEDIKLSLEQWLEKYGASEKDRHKRNYELISAGIGSHIFMSMNNLAELFEIK